MNEYLIIIPRKDDSGPEEFRHDRFSSYVSSMLDVLGITTRKFFCYSKDNHMWFITCFPEQMTMVVLQLSARVIRTTNKSELLSE